MAESPTDNVTMTHPDVHDDDGPVVVTVTRHEYESVWKGVGWKLRSTTATTKPKEK